MHVVALSVELHLPGCHSLKDKRTVVRPLLDGCRRRFEVAAAEVAHQDLWQRARVAAVAVSASASHAGEVLDAVERFIWSHPELEVVATERTWVEAEEAVPR